MTEIAATTALWHPFARMSDVVGHEFMIDRAEGVWIWDRQGNRYLDATASLWYANVGHGRKRIADAMAEQVMRLDAYSIFGDYTNEPASELASRLARVAPMNNARVFLTTGGGDGVETAVKLARLYWNVQGERGRTHVIGRASAYHGCFGFGTSLGGIAANRDGFGPLVPDTSSVPYDSLPALQAEIERVGPGSVAAFICEPVMGAGGVLLPPAGYLEGAAALCAEHGVLFIADSVIAGFGRLGNWFGIERWNVRPDMVVFAKGVTSGYQPLGGVAVAGEIADAMWASEAGSMFAHGTTFAGHPVCCAAALANLDILEEEDLFARSLALEGELERALAPLRDRDDVAEVRAGVGLLAAVELDAELQQHVPQVARAARDAGVLVRAVSSGGAIAVSPPLVAEPDHFALIADALSAAIDTVQQGAPTAGRTG
jgi:putrescine aminotransferase